MKQKNTMYYFLYGMLPIFLLWFGISTIFRIPILPSPIKVFQTFFEIFYPTLLCHALFSLERIVLGIFFAMIIGLPVGIIMGYFPKIDRLFSPLIYFTYPIPKIALLPIIMILFGLGEGSKVIMIVLIIVFQILVSVRDAVKKIPGEYYLPLLTVNASLYDKIKVIVLPACLPKVFTSLRIGMATSFSVLFFTETFGTTYGIGFFIMDAWMRMNYLQMYTGIVLISIMGLLLFFLIDVLEKKYCKWSSTL